MQALKYVQSLLPHFGRDRIQEDLRMTRTAIETTALAAYDRALEVFPRGSLRDKDTVSMEKYFLAKIKVAGRQDGLIAGIRQKLAEIAQTLDYFEQVVDKDFEQDVVAEGVTLKKANVLRYIELAAFLPTYAMRLLNFIYVAEAAASGAKDYTRENLTQGEIKAINDIFPEFVNGLEVMARSKQELQKTLDSLPEVLVNVQSQTALSSLPIQKTDALGLFSVRGFYGNPIYHVGKMVMVMQADRYKRNQELLKVLELRKIHLEQQRQGQTSDPGLEKEIATIQGRIETLNDKLRADEESVQ